MAHLGRTPPVRRPPKDSMGLDCKIEPVWSHQYSAPTFVCLRDIIHRYSSILAQGIHTNEGISFLSSSYRPPAVEGAHPSCENIRCAGWFRSQLYTTQGHLRGCFLGRSGRRGNLLGWAFGVCICCCHREEGWWRWCLRDSDWASGTN